MPEICAHHGRHKPTTAFVETTLEAARQRFAAAGQRWTPQRERAFQLLLEADGPVKAYDLMARFGDGAPVAPPTVYRALDALVAQGLAHRIASLNAYTACHLHGGDHTASFLICDCCGAAEEISAPVGALLDGIKARSGFKPDHVTVEAHGKCEACQA